MADLAAIGWAAGPALPSQLTEATSARLPDGKAIVMGGSGRNHDGASTLIFDPTTMQWGPERRCSIDRPR